MNAYSCLEIPDVIFTIHATTQVKGELQKMQLQKMEKICIIQIKNIASCHRCDRYFSRCVSKDLVSFYSNFHAKDTVQKLSIYFSGLKVVPQELKGSENKTIFDHYIGLSKCKQAMYL